MRVLWNALQHFPEQRRHLSCRTEPPFEIVQLSLLGKFSFKHEIPNLFKAGFLSQILNGVPAVSKADAFFANGANGGGAGGLSSQSSARKGRTNRSHIPFLLVNSSSSFSSKAW